MVFFFCVCVCACVHALDSHGHYKLSLYDKCFFVCFFVIVYYYYYYYFTEKQHTDLEHHEAE